MEPGEGLNAGRETRYSSQLTRAGAVYRRLHGAFNMLAASERGFMSVEYSIDLPGTPETQKNAQRGLKVLEF